MDRNRLNRKVFEWSYLCKGRNCKNWCFKVCNMFENFDMNRCTNIEYFLSKREIAGIVENKIFEDYKESCLQDVNRERARSGGGQNKLRFYRIFKQMYEVEPYCLLV